MSIARIPKNQVLTRNTIEQREHEDNAAARRVLLVDELGNPINEANRLPTDTIVHIAQVDADTPVIANIVATLANQEYSYTFPAKTVKCRIKVRTLDAIIKYAWISGQSGIEYFTINLGVELPLDHLYLDGKTIYFQVSKPGRIIEIESWY
jgi:hypothetical protein